MKVDWVVLDGMMALGKVVGDMDEEEEKEEKGI